MRGLLKAVTAVLMVLVAYLVLWPVAIDPEAWTPPEPPEMAGRYAPNVALKSVERLAEGRGIGPEDVAVDLQGRIYGGMADGRILRLAPDGTGGETFADTGGRPLGLHFDAAGNLIVADAMKGLLSIAPDSALTILATQAGGVPFRFTDDVDIGADGTIYFTDASSKFGYGESLADVFEHRANGRFLAYDPKTRGVRVLLDDLYFANGVAVSPDQRSVLVAETSSYRIRRYWIAGPKAGTAETFVDNLPGFPDGVSSNGRDTFWVAIFAPRNPAADGLAGSPFLRKVVWRLPDALKPKPERYSFILGLDHEGRVVANLQDPEGGFAPITSVEQVGDVLYLGSLVEPAIGRIASPR